jgi:molybdenum cofactor biosynthesis protein B
MRRLGVEEHRDKAPKKVRLAIITVSDTRTEEDDLSGLAIKSLAEGAGHVVAKKAIVKDDVKQIQKTLREIIEQPALDAVVISGGTGISGRDVTLEAVEDFREKSLPGFGELFRMLSYDEIKSAAMMSRAEAFVTEGKIVFCLPGSEKAVRLAMTKLIIPELGHIVWEIRR